eukprot:11410062-Ditylum_brightwellii.AAC.1
MPKKISYDGDDMIARYMHLRESIRKVRPEVYETIDVLKSTYHMSETQAHVAMVVVGNKLFERTWKVHDEDADIINLDTLPELRCSRIAGK